MKIARPLQVYVRRVPSLRGVPSTRGPGTTCDRPHNTTKYDENSRACGSHRRAPGKAPAHVALVRDQFLYIEEVAQWLPRGPGEGRVRGKVHTQRNDRQVAHELHAPCALSVQRAHCTQEHRPPTDPSTLPSPLLLTSDCPRAASKTSEQSLLSCASYFNLRRWSNVRRGNLWRRRAGSEDTGEVAKNGWGKERERGGVGRMRESRAGSLSRGMRQRNFTPPWSDES